MAVVYSHQNRGRFALRIEREVSVVGGGVQVDTPAPIFVDGGVLEVGRNVEAVIEKFAEVSVSRTASLVGGGVTVDTPNGVTVSGGALSVSRSVSVSTNVELPEIDKSITVSRAAALQGGGVNVDEQSGTNVEGGAESTTRSASVSINVVGANEPPNAVLSATITSPGTVEWDASGSFDPNGDPLTFRFDFGSDGTVDVDNATGVASKSYALSGTRECTVTVEDPDQATDSQKTSIFVDAGGRN